VPSWPLSSWGEPIFRQVSCCLGFKIHACILSASAALSVRVVAAWLTRRVVARVPHCLAVVGRSAPLTSRSGQLHPLPPFLAACFATHRGRPARQSRCGMVASPRRARPCLATISPPHACCVATCCVRGAPAACPPYAVITSAPTGLLPFPRAVTMPGTRCFVSSASGYHFSIHLEHDFIF
jgi:hypothetical protein